MLVLGQISISNTVTKCSADTLTKVSILEAGVEVEGVEGIPHVELVAGHPPVLGEAVMALVVAVQEPGLGLHLHSEVLAAETRTNNWASGLIVANTIGVPAAGKWS